MQTKALILEKPSDPNVLARTPGVYVAPSSSPSYGVLRGLVVAGAAKLLGETYQEDGQQQIMVEVGRMRRNASDADEESGSMTMGHRFFIKAFEEYRDWREKWWREAIQNAVDAGASKVACLLTLLDAEGRPTNDPALARTVQASCEDNGKGMDRDTFVTKFMAFGETGKGEAESL